MTPEARRQIQATIAQLQALLDADCDCPEANPVTVRELWDRYLQTLPEAQWVASVRSTMIRLLARIGDIKATALNPSDWENYRDLPEIREHYSVTTRNIQRKRMRTMLTWAVDTGRLASNPWQRVKPERSKPKRQTEIMFDGEAAVLDRLVRPYQQAFVIVALDSAMRRDEIRLMEWTDIDWTTRKITIPAGRTKSRKQRIGRLTSRAADAIMTIPPTPGCPWVFANPQKKKPWSRAHLWAAWREAADGAGLQPAPGDESVRFHDTRRTAARRLSRLGAPIASIQQILGHESLAVTATYVDANAKDVDEAHALLEAHLLLEKHGRKGPHRASASLPPGAGAGAAGATR